MDDGGPSASILLLFCLIGLEAVFRGFSCALQNLNVKEEERRAVEEKDKKSSRLCRMNRDPDSCIGTAQAVTVIFCLLTGAFFLRPFFRTLSRAASLLAGQDRGWIFMAAQLLFWLLAVLAALFFYFLLGVWIPGRLSLRSPEKWARRLVNFVWTVTACLRPFQKLISLTGAAVLSLFGVREPKDRDDDTEYEIISMVNEGHERGVIQASEAEMITNIFEFSDKEAKDIMTNRRDIEAIDCRMSFGEAVRFMLNGSNSRYPVYEENIDHIIGILHMKDALRRQSQIDPGRPLSEIPDLLRQVRFIPETRKIDGLFKTMQSMKLQMVIVVDEYGQTSGLIAMEDILEEIVGNILDEYDDEESFIQEKGKNEYVIDGKTRLEDLEERFSIRFHEDTFETINGYLIAKLEHIPGPEEQFHTSVDGYDFKILKVENKMISQVLVTRPTGDGQAAADQETDEPEEKD